MIERDGEPFALLIETERGSYLVPPIVIDQDGNVIEGQDVLAAMNVAGVEIDSTDGGVWRGHTANGAEVACPCLAGKTVADLAEIDQVMSRISEQLGVPVGPPA
jgi:hypothetical protein